MIRAQHPPISPTLTAISRPLFPRFTFRGYSLIHFIHQLLRKQWQGLSYTSVWPVVTLLKASISLIPIETNAESSQNGQKEPEHKKWFGLGKILCFYFHFLQKKKKKQAPFSTRKLKTFNVKFNTFLVVESYSFSTSPNWLQVTHLVQFCFLSFCHSFLSLSFSSKKSCIILPSFPLEDRAASLQI